MVRTVTELHPHRVVSHSLLNLDALHCMVYVVPNFRAFSRTRYIEIKMHLPAYNFCNYMQANT